MKCDKRQIQELFIRTFDINRNKRLSTTIKKVVTKSESVTK